jgi:hypothetical protein
MCFVLGYVYLAFQSTAQQKVGFLFQGNNMTDRFKKGAWRFIKNKSVSAWAHNKEQDHLAGTEKKNAKEGHVYIFSLGNDGLYKVGCTYSIEKRLKELRSGNPKMKCVWSAWSKDMLGLEKKLHSQFSEHKVDREIFVLTPGEIMQANNIANQFRENY